MPHHRLRRGTLSRRCGPCRVRRVSPNTGGRKIQRRPCFPVRHQAMPPRRQRRRGAVTEVGEAAARRDSLDRIDETALFGQRQQHQRDAANDGPHTPVPVWWEQFRQPARRPRSPSHRAVRPVDVSPWWKRSRPRSAGPAAARTPVMRGKSPRFRRRVPPRPHHAHAAYAGRSGRKARRMTEPPIPSAAGWPTSGERTWRDWPLAGHDRL